MLGLKNYDATRNRILSAAKISCSDLCYTSGPKTNNLNLAQEIIVR